MAVVIRLKRTGRKNRPCYRISVADSRFPRDGRTLDTLGLYDPANPIAEKQTTLEVERAKEWIGRGAKPSETVNSILKRFGVYEGAPAPTKRSRPGRKKATKTGAKRTELKSARDSRKSARRAERVNVRKAAKKAAAAATEGEGGDE